MRKVSRSALVPYSANQMFALVEDIDAYPSFLPWCAGATVHSKDAESIEASLEIRRSGMSKSFRTRNTLHRDEAMDIALVGGPFKHLAGGWRFGKLGDGGCKVSLELGFEFENRVVDAVFGYYFENTCSTMVDAFARRAQQIYG